MSKRKRPSLVPTKFNKKHHEVDSETENEENDEVDADITLKIASNIDLPGGSAKVSSYKTLGSSIGEVPKYVSQYIRDYFDILINAVMLEARFLISTELQHVNSILAIPGTVYEILKYNNICFKTVKWCTTKVDLHEPVWYTFNIQKSELILYINEGMYEDFCSKNNSDPVIFTSGLIPIEMYNPYEVNPNFEPIQLSMVHCAIASDHVAQHIIYDVMYSEKKIASADIHYHFADYGTTLHSIFRIQKTCSKIPKREYSSFINLGDLSAPSSSKYLSPMLRSTRQIIDSIIPPNNNSELNSNQYLI